MGMALANLDEPLYPDLSVEKGTQVWNLQDADIRAVIDAMAHLTGRSFIVDPQVQGKISFVSTKPLTQDEIYQVFLSLLQVLNYTAVENNGVVKILPIAMAREIPGQIASKKHPGHGDEIVARVVPIHHVSATLLVPILRPLLHRWGSVSSYLQSNTLLIVGSAQNVSRIVALAKEMDSKHSDTTKVFNLKQAIATDVAQTITYLANGRHQGALSHVSIVADSHTNSVIVNGTYFAVTQISKLITKLDQKASEKTAQTKVIHLQYMLAKDLAPILNKVISGDNDSSDENKQNLHHKQSRSSLSYADFNVEAESFNNVLIVHAKPDALATIQSIVKELDVKPQQVMVQALIVKIDQSAMRHIGVEWGALQANASMPQTGQFPIKFLNGVGVVNSGNIGAVINAVLDNSSTQVVSTPSIMVLNNQKAVISDGVNVGLVNRKYSEDNSSTGSQTPYNTIERQDIGLSLTVTPYISPNSMLQLKIDETDDSPTQQSSTSLNQSYNTSQISTQVLVKSGDMLVLGGLLSETDQHGKVRVPLLSRIPLLGKLFTSDSGQEQKKDLMVFLRPVIVSDSQNSMLKSMYEYNQVRKEQKKYQQSQPQVKVLPELEYKLLTIPVPAITVEPKNMAITKKKQVDYKVVEGRHIKSSKNNVKKEPDNHSNKDKKDTQDTLKAMAFDDRKQQMVTQAKKLLIEKQLETSSAADFLSGGYDDF